MSKAQNVSTESMKTAADAIKILKADGFTKDYNLIFKDKTPEDIPPIYRIKKVYRFEGESNPSDEEVVYAIEDQTNGQKGVFVDGYGIYTDPHSADILTELLRRR